VKQGDIIAQVGQSGNVDRPQLHFELRKGTRAVDPKSLI
jgi:murein DD-endopeptidase MepM/ murein hydrolase activator NlpD